MGKRKSKGAKPALKKRALEKLDTVFCCPFCNHGDSVECKLDRKNGIGEAICRVCAERYCTKITRLSEPIDVYSEWIDECEKANDF